VSAFLDATREAASTAAGLADEGERERRLPQASSEAIRDAGVYRMLVPASLGGGEVRITEMVEALEILGRADGAAGWCAMVAATAGLALAHLDPGTAGEVFSSPETVLVGVFAPRGRAERSGDRLTVNGRWPFGSNIANSDWVLGGCMIEGEAAPRLVLIRRDEVEVIDTWNVAGLRGTGSHDFAVSDLELPAARAADPATTFEPGPLYILPMFSTLAIGIAAVALGIAGAAVDDLVELASVKVPRGSRRRLAEREVVQAAVARSRGEVMAARALLLAEAAGGWAEAVDGEIGLERRASLRIAATHAANAAVRATDEVFRHGGAGSIYETSSLQRRFRDVHVAAQHMMVAPPTYELAGRVELGLEIEGRGL
jgi:alkylation response protein AidB-like acyl-CoA dehydrogenase